MSRGDDDGTLAQEAVLTHKLIEGIQDEDEGFELLEEFSIDTTGAADIHDIKRFLRIALRDKSKENFKCVKCDLKRTELDDFENQYDVVMGCKLLEEHFIPSDGVTTVSQVKDLFEEHLQLKENLEPYDLSEVAEVVKTLMEQNTQGRLKMLRKYGMLKDFVSRIPSERQEDISNQLPDLDSDMQHVYSMLNKDNCTIMIAGETGAGKTCLLNLLLGELGADLLPVSNLPQTSAVCEIKYDTERYLKAYPVDQSKCAETVPLSRTNAAEKISEYVADKAEERNVKYSRVEVYWPCEWIQHGITITDTPGVGESEEFTKVVKDYIPKASGFIYVINTPNAGGINSEELGDLLFYHITREGIREDKDVPFGQQLQEKVHFDPRSAVFVCNKWDQVPTAEQQEVKDYVKDRLQKVWRDFDFETQVFFISIKQVAKEIQSGYVPQEYRRLLSGIQNLLPIGFKARMERQFWKMYHIMDRSMWVLNNYIRCDEKTERQVKKDQYRNAKKRLQELEKRPKKARKEMNEILSSEVKSAMDRIRGHLESKEAQERLTKWHNSDCPDVDNIERLHILQNAVVQKRIVAEIQRFEQEEQMFEKIQKKVMEMFSSIFISVETELLSIEDGLRQAPEHSSLTDSLLRSDIKSSKPSSLSKGKKHVWAPLGVIVKAFALPSIGVKSLKKAKKERKLLEQYRLNKPAEMARVTVLQVKELVSPEGKKLQEVLEDKLTVIRKKFDLLLDRIPQLIQANKLLLDHLEQTEALTSFKNYIPLTEEGDKVMNELNLDYLTYVRSYDIDMEKVRVHFEKGKGQFALVYSGSWDMRPVAVKRLKKPLSERNATEFLLEELTMRRIQSPHVITYYGTALKKAKDKLYPAMILEYGNSTLDSIIFNPGEYQGPGTVKSGDEKRIGLLRRAARYCDETCRGLQALHQLGLVHRDVKPDNILVDSEGHIKLCDLGLAIREQDIIGDFCGARAYMAPEVMREEKYNRAVDIFSFGIMSWEIWYGTPLTEQHGYDGTNLRSFMKKPFHSHEPSTEWRDLFYKCCSEDTRKRPHAGQCSLVFRSMYPH